MRKVRANFSQASRGFVSDSWAFLSCLWPPKLLPLSSSKIAVKCRPILRKMNSILSTIDWRLRDVGVLISSSVYCRVDRLEMKCKTLESVMHWRPALIDWLMKTNRVALSVKLHYADTGYGHVVHPNILTCRDFALRFATCQIFVRWWWICCTTSCRIVVSLSVGGVVQHVRSRCPCSGVWH